MIGLGIQPRAKPQ